MINASLREGCFPRSQKRAIVTPLLKKPGPDADELKSYRTVSNLTFMSKLVDTASRVTRPRLQTAYRRHHSTETALLKILSDIFAATNCQQVTLLGLLDLSAALDCVDDDILLRRLGDKFGVTGSAHDWTESFLSGRTEQVYYNGRLSAVTLLQYGVPQGSVRDRSCALLALCCRSPRRHHRMWTSCSRLRRRYTGSRESACNTSLNCDAATSQLHDPDP